MFSTMTTAPSTTMPKSSAPKESRLAGMCLKLRQMAANSRENGMVSATIKAPRALPRNRNRIRATSAMPSVRLCSTVCVVKCTRLLRSRNGTIFTPGGRKPSVQLLNLVVDGFQSGIGIGALAQQDDAFHHVGVIEHRAVGAVDRLADLSQADLRPLRHAADVFDADRCAVLRFDYGLGDIVDRPHQADGADVDLLQSRLHKAAAGVDVVIGQLLLHLPDAQAVIHQLVGIEE